MKDIIQRIFSNDLQDLKGLKVTGQVPINPDLINEVISQILHPEIEAASEKSANTPTSGTLGAKGIKSLLSLGEDADLMSLVRNHVKTAEVRVADGKIVVDFYVQVD